MRSWPTFIEGNQNKKKKKKGKKVDAHFSFLIVLNLAAAPCRAYLERFSLYYFGGGGVGVYH